MPQRLSATAFSLIALLAAAACSDGGGALGNKPFEPPGRTTPLGIIRGTVTGDSMTAEFVPMGAAGAVNSAMSPAIYGGSSTVAVTGRFVSLVDNVPVNNRTWTFNVHMRNLLSYAIGSNYSASNPAPRDTSGVFLVFSVMPTVTSPTPCHSCAVTVPNYAGIGTFDKLNETYFWYKNRPTALQGSPSTDTTANAQWIFIGTFKPATADTVHSFSFILMVSAAWPMPNDTAWAYNYNGKTDSLPSTVAKPRWKTPFHQVKNYTQLGTVTWNPGVDLVLQAAANNNAIFIARNDSMDATKSASVDFTAQLGSSFSGAPPIQALVGYAEPGGKMAVLGLYQDHIAFVSLNVNNGQWSDIPGFTLSLTGTTSHRYRIRKFGTLDIHLCVDGVALLAITNASLDATSADFATSTVFYGALGNNKGVMNLHVTNVAYTLGTDGGSC